MKSMNTRDRGVRDTSALDFSDSLKEQIRIMSEKCIKCKLCQKECAFLRKFGKPKDIADNYDPTEKLYQGMPFECSLCQLCAAVCPAQINPAEMFLDMRRETVRRGKGNYSGHARILGYEKRGISKKYTFYALPQGCDTVLFPGCALAGTRPHRVKDLYAHIQRSIPSLGIVLDCCALPSHDLGRADDFHRMFDQMRHFLLNSGIRHVVVACPSCYKVFKQYGYELTVTTAYKIIAEMDLPVTGQVNGIITVQDSCASRFDKNVHDAVRDLASAKGLSIEEMPHCRNRTFCCGEGGSVSPINPDFAENWGHMRKREADGKKIVTYCAGCASLLGSSTPTIHILDLVFEPRKSLSGKAKIARSPFTYLNRLKLKNYFKKTVQGPVTRERTFRSDTE